jgi:integrase
MNKSNQPQPYKPAKFIEAEWRWYIEFHVWDEIKGKLVRKRFSKITGETKAEKRRNGRRIAAQINKMLADGYVIKKPESAIIPENKLTTLDAFQMAVKVKVAGGGRRTQQAYESCYRIVREWIDSAELYGLPIEDFEQKHVFSFLDWLKEEREVSNRTRNNYRDYLKSLLNVLMDRQIILTNPARNVGKLKTKSTSHVAFTKDQQAVLEDHLRRNDPHLFDFTRFIYYAFLRPVEITRIQVKHIDLENRLIMVRAAMAKSLKQQPIYIVKPLCELIQDMNLENLPDETYLFSRDLKPGETQLHPNRVTERHRAALEATQLYNGELTMYSWKYTGACNAYRAGMDIKTLQAHLRHHSLDMTEIYLRSMGLRTEKELQDMEW